MTSHDLKFSWASTYPMDIACFLMIYVAERLSPDVSKFVLALGTADSQPVRFDFIFAATNAPHVDVFLTLPMLLQAVLLLHCVWR